MAAGLAAAVAAWIVEPRLLVAAAIGFVIYKVGTAMLRNMAADAKSSPPPPEPVTDPNERTVYRCELCGTEVLLVVRGEETAPRHCGERMSVRTEVPRN